MERTLPNLVCEVLNNIRASGEERVAIDDSAREILREQMRVSRAMKTVSLVKREDSTFENGQEIPQTVEGKLDFLRRKAMNWPAARRLGTLRETMVFSVGNPHADLMLVGEAPGYDEERLKEPFVGKAGQKLNQILAAMGLKREELYISNVCKFRPSMENQGTANRTPTDEEIASCRPLIMAEIRAIRPKCIVCLGGTAAKGLLGEEKSVSSFRGEFHSLQGIPLRVTYHPSYLLRNETMSAKRAVWEDMLAVMEILNLPITEKQKRYFLSSHPRRIA